MAEKVRALFAWSEAGGEAAVRIAGLYRKAGMEVLLYGQAEAEGLQKLGEREAMTHVLYFQDEERLLLISLADEMGGFTVEAKVSDLVLPQ